MEDENSKVADEEESEDSFVVPDGYLSDNEVCTGYNEADLLQFFLYTQYMMGHEHALLFLFIYCSVQAVAHFNR